MGKTGRAKKNWQANSQERKNRLRKKEKGTISKSHIRILETELNPMLQGNILYDYIFNIFIPLLASHLNTQPQGPAASILVLLWNSTVTYVVRSLDFICLYLLLALFYFFFFLIDYLRRLFYFISLLILCAIVPEFCLQDISVTIDKMFFVIICIYKHSSTLIITCFWENNNELLRKCHHYK